MSKNEDLRVLRTRRLITQAFIQLLRHKRFEKISIQEIADLAMINRATFYAHYSGKQDLYDGLIDAFIDDFFQILDQESLIDEDNVYVAKIESVLTRFYDFVSETPELVPMILDKSQDEHLIRQLRESLTKRYNILFEKLEVRERGLEVPTDFVLSYITAILVGTLKWWVSSGQPKMKSRDFSHLIIKLISNGHLTVLGVNIDRQTKS